LILQTSSRHTKTIWLRYSQPGFAILSHPLSVWVLYYASCSPSSYSCDWLRDEHMWLMDIITWLSVRATLFWWPMIGSTRSPLGAAIPPDREPPNRCAARVLPRHRTTQLSPDDCSDVQPVEHSCGAGVLWVLTELLTVVAVIPIYFQWMARRTARPPRRRSTRPEAARRDRSRPATPPSARQLARG